MKRNVMDPMLAEDGPVKLKVAPRVCEICGNKYIPTSNNQKFCPACRDGKKHNPAYTKACTPSEVVQYKVETPEAAAQDPAAPETARQVIETPEREIWYECRIKRGGVLMMDARISHDMWLMILDSIK